MLKNLKKDFSQYGFLFSELVKRDFKAKYKRTVLGVLWSFLDPLFHFAVMFFVFGTILHRRDATFSIYLFSGLLFINYYTGGTNGGMTAFVSGGGIFSQMNIPKYIILLAQIVQSIITFGITLIIILLFFPMSGLNLSPVALLIVFPFLCQTLVIIGVGLMLGTGYVFFRDLGHLYKVFTQLLFYVSAIFFTPEMFPESLRVIFYINPVYHYASYARGLLLEGKIPSATEHFYCILFPMISLTIGVFVFKKHQHKFLYHI